MQHGPHAEDVAPRVRRAACETLWTRVRGTGGIEPGGVLRVGVETEPDELDLGFAERWTGHHDRAGRHVSVEESGLVHCFQAGGDLEDELEGFADRVGRPRAQEIDERLPDGLFEDDVGGPVLEVAHGQHRGDVRVPDPRRRSEGARVRGLLPWTAGRQDQQNDPTAFEVFRFVQWALRCGAGSLGDTESTSDGPSDQARVVGTAVIERHRGS